MRLDLQKLLKGCHPVRYNALVLSGQLWNCLADINEQVQERLELVTTQIMAAKAVTEEQKAVDPMAWVGSINSIRGRAEEIVIQELILGEDLV